MQIAPLAFTVDRAELLQATAAALQVVETKTTIPILTNFLLRAEAGGLVVTGTNLDQWTAAQAPADVTAIGAVAVQAKPFHDVITKLPKGARVSVAADPKTGRTTVSSGRSRFQLPSLPVEDFPGQDGGSRFEHKFDVAGSILASMITRCHFAISSEETRYYLNGIYCHVVEAEGALTLRFVATDGHRLARIDATKAEGIDLDMPGIIIPRKMVDAIRKLAADADTAIVEIEVSPSLIRASTGRISITSKLIDGTYPDYARAVPTDFAREAVAPTLALIEAVDRVSTLSLEKMRGVKLDFQADKLAVTIRNPNDGEAYDELDIELDGAPLIIGCNAKYLAEILAQTGGDTVRIKLGADTTQALVIGDKLAESLFVLMPMRV